MSSRTWTPTLSCIEYGAPAPLFPIQTRHPPFRSANGTTPHRNASNDLPFSQLLWTTPPSCFGTYRDEGQRHLHKTGYFFGRRRADLRVGFVREERAGMPLPMDFLDLGAESLAALGVVADL